MGKTLYICRPLINADEFIAWAKGQGFATTLPADDLHATIIYSKTEVEEWPELQDDQLVVRGKGRAVKPLGDQGAVVLQFESKAMEKRWQELLDLGAKSDYPSFTPHVTITWKADGVDLDKVDSYTGPLVFGPEIAEEIELDWRDGIMEKYSPNQLRVPAGVREGGRWAPGGTRGENIGLQRYTHDLATAAAAGYRSFSSTSVNPDSPLREFTTLVHPRGWAPNAALRAPERGAVLTINRFADGRPSYRVNLSQGSFWGQAMTDDSKSFTDLKSAMSYADDLQHGVRKDDGMPVNYTVTKVDDELGVVFGWAIVSTVKGDPYYDVQGDYIPDGSMLKATTDFMEHERVGKDMHTGDQVGTIVHSMPLTKEIAKAFGITCDKTGWMVGYKPYDKQLLEKFRNGSYTGFSIGGDRVKDVWAD